MFSSLRVAIVESDIVTLQCLQQMISELGHEVIVITESGPSLIDCCANRKPDVILTGKLAPQINEADITAGNKNWRIPVILYAEHCDRELVLNAEHKQVFMYLVKPIRREHLKVALDGCCLQRIRQPRDDDMEDGVVLVTDSREYTGNARYGAPTAPSYSSTMLRAAH